MLWQLLVAYLWVALIIALRLGWHMATRLDAYDWFYNKFEIWGTLALSVVLWPFLLLAPRWFADPTELFQFKLAGMIVDIAARERERNRLRDDPPPCGLTVRYVATDSLTGESTGEFLFPAAAVEVALASKLVEHPHLGRNDECDILNWVLHRHDTLLEPTDVPALWYRFMYVADTLLQSGQGIAICVACRLRLSADQLQQVDQRTGR